MSLIHTILDWETAYGKHPTTGENITLSRMTTEEYVRHPLFKVHGLGVKIGAENAFYVYGEELLHFLRTHPWERSFAICHHAQFDGAILSWRAGIRPAFWGCTLSMARAIFPHEPVSLVNISRLLNLGEKGKELVHFAGKWALTNREQTIMSGYCRNDVDLTAAAFDAMEKQFSVSELRLVDLTIRLFAEPVLEVDRGILIDEYKRERRSKQALLKKCSIEKATLTSNPKFANLLLTLGVDPPKKLSPSKVKDGRIDPDNVGEPPRGILPVFTTKGVKDVVERQRIKAEKNTYPWAYAFGKQDEKFKLLLDHPDPQVQAVVEARFGVKSTIKETRSKRFYKIGTRGAFPIYLVYYGAHTGRWSGGDKQNAQNLTRVNPKDPTSGALRRSLLAPPNHLLVVRDLGQIEARKLAYWAGQEDLLQVFRDGGDPYNRQASKIFGYTVDRKLDQFWLEGLVGKSSTLGNGYGMGWSKFQESLRVGFMGAPPLLFNQEAAQKLGADIDAFCYQRSYKKGFAHLRDEALTMKPLNVGETEHLWHCAAVKMIVDKYRESNAAIVAGWKEAGWALHAIEQGQEIPVGQRGLVSTCKEGFLLPNGMKIRYNKLRSNEKGEFRYLSNVRKKEWSYIYGGKAVENCIAGGTQVLTNNGFKPIENITLFDKVHDGVDFVPHGGIVYKSIQGCTIVDGVYMTPDHEVLTDEGWKVASSHPEPYRPDIRLSYSSSASAFEWKKTVLGIPVSMRGVCCKSRGGCDKRGKTRWGSKLWVSDQVANAGELYSRNVQTPRIRNMAFYVRSMSSAFTSSMEKLRWARNCCLSRMATSIRDILGGYGRYLLPRAVFRTQEQRFGVQPRELLLGFCSSAGEQPTQQCVDQYPQRAYDNSAGGAIVPGGGDDTALSHKAQLAGRQIIYPTRLHESRVYDIKNCGSRQRFVVLGDSGVFVVHNCVQALARIVLSDQMLNIQRWLVAQKTKEPNNYYQIVTSTHDEVVCCVPTHRAEECLQMMQRVMGTAPAWCPGLPLKSSGGYAQSYGECEK